MIEESKSLESVQLESIEDSPRPNYPKKRIAAKKKKYLIRKGISKNSESDRIC
jgi:hypothetical protein